MRLYNAGIVHVALNSVFDGSAENFSELVIANSRKGPVLVNYWSPKAGPCLELWETLQALSQEYRGRFLLVNINTEKQPRLVRKVSASHTVLASLQASSPVKLALACP